MVSYNYPDYPKRRRWRWGSKYQTSKYYPSRKKRRYQGGKPSFSNYVGISNRWGRYSGATTRVFGGQTMTRSVHWGAQGQEFGPWSPVLT